MDTNLLRYLNDHLAGSAGAVDLIGSLVSNATDPEERDFFRELKSEVESDRVQLKQLIDKLGGSGNGLLEAAAGLTAKAGKLKLRWEGLQPGELGYFEALEMLALGIQGKRVLWIVLQEILPWVPEWQDTDFAALELQAIAQRDQVEERRLAAGREALVEKERRAKHAPVAA